MSVYPSLRECVRMCVLVHLHVDECAHVCRSEEPPERAAVVEEGSEDRH